MLHGQHQRPASPPWKIRSKISVMPLTTTFSAKLWDIARPCPFYSSGRCLFSTSCNFRHVIKSPLTPIDHKPFYIPEAPKNESPEFQEIDTPNFQQQHLRESSQGSLVLSDIQSHTRNPSTASHAFTVSSTETGTTGTVRGYVNQDDSRYRIFLNETESPVLGLGLTNLYEPLRSPTTPSVELPSTVSDPIIDSTNNSSYSSIDTRSRERLSDFVFPKENNTVREVPPPGRQDTTNVQPSQEVEVHSRVTSNFISLVSNFNSSQQL
jgi:hypothetical protein